METLRDRLEHDLNIAVGRLRHLDGTLAVEELPGPSGGQALFADEVDAIHASESREMGFATRERLVERVNRLSVALDRLNLGEYGTCVECDETISPARLHAMPEVQTCVRCQDRLERTGRRSQRAAIEPEPQFAEELMED
jgi:RNA polymerase-binding transcription factor DksA